MNRTAFVLVVVATASGLTSFAPISGRADEKAAQRRTP